MTSLDREGAMVVIERDENGVPTVWCDEGVADIVSALNVAGINTIWSCDGHGHRPGVVGLKDGRQLLILDSLKELKSISHLWPGINGEPASRKIVGYANRHHIESESVDGVAIKAKSEFFNIPVYADVLQD